MRNAFAKKLMAVLPGMLFVTFSVRAQFEQGMSSTQLGSVSCNQTMPAPPSVVTYATQGEYATKIKNVVRLKFNELATTTGSPGGPLQYFASGFTATASIKIEGWTNAPTGSQTADWSEVTSLTVNYNMTAGTPYNPIAYIVLVNPTDNTPGKNLGFQQVRVTVQSVTVSGLSGSWTSANVLPLLTVENEMDVLRYFTMTQTGTPTFTQNYDATNHPDQLSVSWTFPSGTNNNISQLEYAWVENETAGFYVDNGSFDYARLFHTNSTRVDIDYASNSFNIPLLYDGAGTLYYRVRSALKQNNGNLLPGPWSAPQSFTYAGHEPGLNWTSETQFAENAKSNTVIQYFDGSLRERQTVTKDNSTGNTIVGETIYDLQGRPNVQIMPTPTISTAIQYFGNFNQFVGQTAGQDPAMFFDLTLPGGQCSGAPQLATTTGNGQYYSASNPWIGKEATANFVPNAGGYAYTETRYTDDPTGRVSIEGGAGPAHQIGNHHETRYYYGKPTQNELDALFGTEAGDASHYFKNLVEDPNQQMSVTYVDMHGRTVATALAGASPTNLASISNPAFYPVSSGLLTDNLLTPATNVILGDSIQSISTILVPATTTYNFTYQLTPSILQEMNTASQPVCFDCKYNLEISVRQEDCSGAAPYVVDYNNLQIEPSGQACSTSMGFTGSGINTPTSTINFQMTLGPGSWIVRKTLTLNDSVLQVREDSALNAFLAKTQKALSDSVFAALSTSSGCALPAATTTCNTCMANLGSYSTYKANLIQAMGGTTTMTDAAIHTQYSQDSLNCAVACGAPSVPMYGTLAALRMQLLKDMTPYTGQYALPLDSISSSSLLQAKYNIFTTSYTGSYGTFGTKPFYQNPVSEPSGATTVYLDDNGVTDNTVYPGGVSTLPTMTPDGFSGLFKSSWAGELIWYHPEYPRLHYAETNLAPSFTWLDNVQQCNTYAAASSAGYLTPLTSDPYFVNRYVVADYDTMSNYLSTSVNMRNTGGFNIWRMANGLALQDTTQSLSARLTFFEGMSTTGVDPSATTTAQQDAVWRAFKGIYLGYRNDMLMTYIANQTAGLTPGLTTAASTELQNEGKQIRFATSAQSAAQNGLTWWSSVTNPAAHNDSSVLAASITAATASFQPDACVDESMVWQSRLMQCEALQLYLAQQDHADSATVTTVINAILDSMIMVCHNSIDANDPYGATNVNPAKLPVTPSSFENIVNHVFSQYGIATLPANYYFCNPYSIDYPKPYGSNPQALANFTSSVDTCNCHQFAQLQSAATSAGYNASNLASMNQYLLANYNDTLSAVLWAGLTQCSTHNFGSGGQSLAMQSFAAGSGVHSLASVGGGGGGNIPLTGQALVPAFLNCGYVKPCITCTTLQTLTAAFRQLYPAYKEVPYTSGGTSVDTGMAKQNALWARYLNYKTGFSKSANEYAAAFLSCGLDSMAANLTISDRNAQPPSGTQAPYAYTASSSIIFAPGFASLPGDNFTASISSTMAGSATAMCALDKPVNYLPLDTAQPNPCQAVQDQANFIAGLLFQSLEDSLIHNFDSLYRAKCLSAQSAEVFYATYQPSEYHYTLYYYDQAGNLVKTLPPDAVKPNFNATYLSQVPSSRAAGTDQTNGTNIENLGTQYRYNTLNLVTAQRTPDGGLSNFWYDLVGRMAVSQNSVQQSANLYTYTLYDPIGRITEVGQKPQATAMTQAISQSAASLSSWLADLTNGGVKQQITRTIYDVPFPNSPLVQTNLRNRISCMQIIDLDNANTYPYHAATYYSYDVHGNVGALLQHYPTGVMSTGNGIKLTLYDYDLISGKINQVRYQPNQADGFFMQYSYDATNRLTDVRTSRDSILWQHDADYGYYRHGQLSRTQLGDLNVQGIDYAYTLDGWLKSINPSYSSDGAGDLYDADGTTNTLFARDAFKLNLHYYDDGTFTDYTPVSAPNGYIQGNSVPAASKKSLYNGNISTQAVDIRKLSVSNPDSGPMLYNYGYDQLNRIISSDAWAASGNFNPTGTSALTDYAERFSYDPNGNIMTLNRNGTSAQTAMDQLTYYYRYAKTAASGGGSGEYIPGQAVTDPNLDHLTNQLSSIRDAVPAANYPNDIDNQSPNNYQYNAIGQLTADGTTVTNVTWNMYGKILSLVNSSGTISFTYDAQGNRLSKTVGGITTWYVRDAVGRVLSVYVQGDNTHNAGAVTQTEVDLYGSSRLGLLNCNVNCGSSLLETYPQVWSRGSKVFELTDHLGNVLETISDKAVQHTSNSSTVDYYLPEVLMAQDYYAFGSPIPGRSLNEAGYRYGFNGKENDNEVKGVGDQQDYGMRIYDPRVGRFLSVDPLQKKYAYYTPYQFSGNTPIQAIDLDGLEPVGYNPRWQGSMFGSEAAKRIPSDYDNAGSSPWVKIDDKYEGPADIYAVQDITNQTYVIFETANGGDTRYFAQEYDKDGYKGNVQEFKWHTVGEFDNQVANALELIPAGGLALPFAIEGFGFVSAAVETAGPAAWAFYEESSIPISDNLLTGAKWLFSPQTSAWAAFGTGTADVLFQGASTNWDLNQYNPTSTFAALTFANPFTYAGLSILLEFTAEKGFTLAQKDKATLLTQIAVSATVAQLGGGLSDMLSNDVFGHYVGNVLGNNIVNTGTFPFTPENIKMFQSQPQDATIHVQTNPVIDKKP